MDIPALPEGWPLNRPDTPRSSEPEPLEAPEERPEATQPPLKLCWAVAMVAVSFLPVPFLARTFWNGATGPANGVAGADPGLILLLAGTTGCLFLASLNLCWRLAMARTTARAAGMVTALRRERAELLRSNRDLEQFAYVASHDLRAPLRNISTLLDWLVEDHGEALAGEAMGKIDDLHRCADRMDALLFSILTYARLGRADAAAEQIDTPKLVADAIRMSAPPPAVQITVEDGLPAFHGIPSRMQQVFSNLISNAIKHNDHADAHIVVSGRADGEFCEFRLLDDGPGIKPQYRERVFEMFKTLKSRDEVEGSGLGLSIVRRTIEQHGGRIWIEDNVDGRGTCIAFTVRRKAPAAADAA